MGAEWPTDLLDVDALLARGFRPVPFQQFVLKVHSRCDLSCEYCFVYAMADQTWRSTAGRMPFTVLEKTAARIAEHVERHGLPRIDVTLHGGEPLLAGGEFLATAAATLRARVPAPVTVGLQTNAVRLDEELLTTFAEHDIRVGVSIDGPAEAHDANRRFADGRGSHAHTAKGLELLRDKRFRHLYGGLLCVIPLDTDPVRTYDALLDHEPPAIDLLLPHANWTTPPRRGYGDWLAAVFDRWYDAPTRRTSIRLFEEIINLFLGGSSRVESVGLSPVALLVVDTGGSFEQVDSLRSAYHGAARTGLNVFDDSMDTALAHPAIAARQIGTRALADACLSCDILDICGGGYYPHRYREGIGFRNPSVYCPDLTRLIKHVAGRVHADLRRIQP
ncbi:hypothetical protein Lesp02_21080 [Lentzea sp. NBRC 105346]|uniref:FxsB family cyclophane-forming radical SAM/SPASM peptide maturase n=1 Tax=Lentzea sp. NBRC 105346 TaxID=3032205 RepID=UPI0024A21E87|nr:FxsB family cyclophane-forming radical SAM/SPASM peptide maturase [Lentzea sp. NBRC 105346]GLZ29918.1 hypothetical protein Lesp02_21080 [Lentzea sp. NBRC 105346]